MLGRQFGDLADGVLEPDVLGGQAITVSPQLLGLRPQPLVLRPQAASLGFHRACVAD